MSLRAVVVDVTASAGTSMVGLIDADEACLESWLDTARDSWDRGVRGDSGNGDDTGDRLETWEREDIDNGVDGDGGDDKRDEGARSDGLRGVWASLSLSVRGKCLSALKEYRYSTSINVTAPPAPAPAAATDIGDHSLLLVSDLCDRLVQLLRSEGRQIAFTSYCSLCCNHFGDTESNTSTKSSSNNNNNSSSSSNCECAKKDSIAAVAALGVSLAFYGTSSASHSSAPSLNPNPSPHPSPSPSPDVSGSYVAGSGMSGNGRGCVPACVSGGVSDCVTAGGRGCDVEALTRTYIQVSVRVRAA